METFLCHKTNVADTFAEAFPVVGTRILITADSNYWAEQAGREVTGHATSVIACDVEASIERALAESESPDGRPGVSVLMFAFDRKSLQKAIVNRVGQNVLTCPTTACYNGITDYDPEKAISLGGQLRFFGDGFQSSKKLGDRRFWRIPVMDGEFLCDEQVGTCKGVGGGNLILCGESNSSVLHAAETAVAAIRKLTDIALPFPGGIVRSGSKVGSKYSGLKASTNEAYCPTLTSRVETELPEGTNSVLEIVMDGLSYKAITQGMQAGINAAAVCDGLTLITAGNYGGKLGPHLFHLRELVGV
ncbi:Formyltransferase/hydrolase complex subunit D [Polystyrenella longa]|uniref:Formylmethanofuran--tetrahydromethanopterin formyltransferase n=1 Tax=Polystyrenella longa TaxID=2528007 RepID=A0A518CQE9_9PLAN|nr:formylmethanofuran--tetrahydromethanopterin N-formyltransferase [Polystyrenella longa]QDU81445.1 Formyltransferase/hydrolase complex subunit D [Polystyrenella longa]